MLVAAAAGLDRIKAAHTHAIAQHYRFFSYGDRCLIESRNKIRTHFADFGGTDRFCTLTPKGLEDGADYPSRRAPSGV
jgi:Queuosine biosynthesis protein